MAWLIKRLFTLALAAVIGLSAYYGYSLYRFASEIQKSPEHSRFYGKGIRSENGGGRAGSGISGGKSGHLAGSDGTGKRIGVDARSGTLKWEGRERVNILLLGGDTRGLTAGEAPRSDSMLVVSIDPLTKKAALLSILRDTYVQIPEYGGDRANVALAIGGPELSMQTVGDLLGLQVHYYVYTDFDGFIELVDAVGGVELDVEKDMEYITAADGPDYDIQLKAGQQLLNGREALGYVRYRNDPLSDFSRTERQRKFMAALGGKLQQTWSLIKLPYILSRIDPYIETNLTVAEMVKLAALGFEVRSSQLESLQVPPPELLVEAEIEGADVLTVDRGELRRYLRERLLAAAAAL